MRVFRWPILLGLSLIVLSALFYLIHYTIFRDPHHIFIYLIGDVAFVFVEVLLVTLIIHELLNRREKRGRLEKLNMVIGTFFSEVGTELLKYFSDFDPQVSTIRGGLIVGNEWSEEQFLTVSKRLKEYDYGIEVHRMDLAGLRSFLEAKRDFLVRLLENPTLLEHESFTELLRAVFHLTEELAARKDITQLPDSDMKHVSGDIRRAYIHLASEWLDYMKHLKNNYPYLFSLATRTNPFDEKASPLVR